MKTTFVKTRAQLTELMQNFLLNGYECYRVRTNCNCSGKDKQGFENLSARQRNGVLIIKGDTVELKAIRCNNCSKPA